MTWTCFEVETRDKIAHVRLSRPEAMNSMNREFWDELPEIVRSIDDAGEARVIVVSSSGRHFTAGMDLSVFTSGNLDPNADAEVGRQRANLRRDVLRVYYASPAGWAALGYSGPVHRLHPIDGAPVSVDPA